MEAMEEKRIKKLLQEISVVNSTDSSKIERMSKYVSKTDKHVFVCLHPSAVVHYYHTHDFFEINYVYEGECINLIEGESLHMKTGAFLMMHPGTFHTVYADSQSKVVNILIQPVFFKQAFSNVQGIDGSSFSLFMNKASSNSYYKYVMCDAECVRQEVTNLMEEEVGNDVNSNIMQEALLSVLFCKLLRNVKEAVISDIRCASSDIMMDMLQYVYDHYNDVTLSELSEKFGYSTAHICRMFMKQTGKTFGDTLTEIKMEKAAAYLRDTKLKVYEIARLVGYDSHEYFHRLFKSRFGVTPFQYRMSRQSSYFTPSLFAATRNTSGSGFDFVISSPQEIASNSL